MCAYPERNRPEPTSPSSIEQILVTAVLRAGFASAERQRSHWNEEGSGVASRDRSRLTSAHQARRRRALLAGESASRTSLTADRTQKRNGGNGRHEAKMKVRRLADSGWGTRAPTILWLARPQLRKAPNHSRMRRTIFTNARRAGGGNIILGRCHMIPGAKRPVNQLISPPICVAVGSRYGESGVGPCPRQVNLGTACRRFGGNVRSGLRR
jgi:hypothetical protein